VDASIDESKTLPDKVKTRAMESGLQELGSEHFIRDRLFKGTASEVDRYRQLVTGRPGLLALLRYELTTMLLGGFPGALGLLLRRLFYRPLFKEAGEGLVIGRHVVIRYPEQISLGRKVVIDDYAVLDARGSGPEGLIIGNEVFVGRGTVIQSKYGPLTIGDNTSIGGYSVICAMGRVTIGRSVRLAGGIQISGGMYHTDKPDVPIADQGLYTRGPIVIGNGTWIGMGALVLDGVSIGENCAIGAGTIVREHVPSNSVIVPYQKLIGMPKGTH
jgi:acetyltransferase-like isoleucine patch superfamily enzyme